MDTLTDLLATNPTDLWWMWLLAILVILMLLALSQSIPLIKTILLMIGIVWLIVPLLVVFNVASAEFVIDLKWIAFGVLIIALFIECFVKPIRRLRNKSFIDLVW